MSTKRAAGDHHQKHGPQPWRRPEDASGWRVVARGRKAPTAPPLITVEVDLDGDQSEWLRQEAERTGLDYVALVKRLVDDARGAP
jgi:hypothetical protein